MSALRTLIAAGVLSFSAVADAGAAPGYLAQKVGPAGCIWRLVAAPCAHGRALDAPESVAISPGGDSVYVASETGLAMFDRAPDGTLSQRPGPSGCTSALLFGDPIVDGCGRGRALDGAITVAISPGGRSVYVASMNSNAIAVFDRAPDGALTQKPGTAGCISDTGTGPCASGTALDSSRSVTVSPDDRNVYVSAAGSSNAIAVLDRAPDGALTQKPGTAGCISSTEDGVGACARSTTLGDASSVTISPDGRSVYATSIATDGAVTSFDRAPNGTLTQKRGTAGCISDTGAGACSDGAALSLASAVTVSPDGTGVYVASEGGGIAVFDRAADGTLTQKPGGAGCFSQSKTGRCTKTTGLRGAVAVTVSPGGENVYAGSSEAVVVFDRAPDGGLTQKPGAQGCISDSGAGPCVRGAALAGAESVAVSPDGNNAYVASFTSRGLAIFDRPATMPPAPPPDTAKPLLTELKIFPTSLRAGGVRPTTGPGRDSLQYVLSEPASVRFTIARVVRGRLLGGRCVKPRRPAGRTTSCSRYASVRGAFTDPGKTGDNDLGFKGRLPIRRLAPGRYRLRAIATDSAGNASAPKHARFKIIRGPRSA